MLKITSLSDFEGPSFENQASVAILQGSPVHCKKENLYDETQPFCIYIRDLPLVNIEQDMLATRESACTIGPENLFLPVQDSVFKKIASIWRERGFIEAVRAITAERQNSIPFPVQWIAIKLSRIIDLLEKGTFTSQVLPSSGSGSVADVSGTKDWANALVRCLSWHPHCARLAVATRDDRIRIYTNGATGVPVLRHSGQKSVCCLSWRPYAGRELAAACQTGVLIWTVELGAASNSLSHATLLKYRNHNPVTSVAWHPQGDLLVSCSLMDLNMIVWDVARESGIPLKRIGGSGLCFARWSICGSRLLVTTCHKIFRVWNIGKGEPWTVEKWTVPDGRVAAACFGPNLSLLFTSTEDPSTIFSLPLQEHIFETKNLTTSNDVKVAVPLIDLNKVTYVSNDAEEVSVGGKVIAMDWHVSGKYLAIIFQDSPLVAIFKTKPNTTSQVSDVKPGHLIQGFPGESPNCIQFYQNYNEQTKAVILTIAWSSGRLQHFPITSDTCPRTSEDIQSHTYSTRDDPLSPFSSMRLQGSILNQSVYH